MSLELANPSNPVQVNLAFDVILRCEDANSGEAAFSCFADLSYPDSLLTVENISYDADYPNYQQGDLGTSGVIDRLGAVSGVNQPSDTQVATVTFRPLQTGNATLSMAADDSPFSENTLYGVDTDQRSTTDFGTLDFVIEENQCETTTIGIYRDSDRSWFLRYTNTGGPANNVFPYGSPSDVSLVGDWDGDGFDSVGIRRGNEFFLRNSNSSGPGQIQFKYGVSSDIPVIGDWNGDGVDTVGIYRPSQARWYLRNDNSAGPPDITFLYGIPNEVPLVGDWDGDGIDTIGIYRTSDRKYFLRNSNSGGIANLEFVYGNPDLDVPLVGDWNGDCIDTVGTYRGSQQGWFLRNTNTSGPANLSFLYGILNEKPVVGAWDQGG